ncbi:MAG: dTDP-4-dehydrorhamnose 3,5-epimerase [Oscillibacter sp.]|jgi:dTDP-4-dehydrorhamnose 3,5-epimerase|nr:dTDP-4-dehydrorhamnose 3,5-epimerase [Oscillibacter sp.]
MPFSIENTEISGLKVIHPHVFRDQRGYFIKDFDREFFELNGLPTEFGECNESESQKGTLRGIHFQTKFPQGKLIRVSKGRAYYVTIDLREDSASFGKWKGFYLSGEEPLVVHIPPRFGHGFLALEDHTVFTYKCTERFAPDYDCGILYNDPELAISWPMEGLDEIIISDKDKKQLSFSDYKKTLLP